MNLLENECTGISSAECHGVPQTHNARAARWRRFRNFLQHIIRQELPALKRCHAICGDTIPQTTAKAFAFDLVALDEAPCLEKIGVYLPAIEDISEHETHCMQGIC